MTIFRASVCGSARASATLLTLPVGIPAAFNSSSHQIVPWSAMAIRTFSSTRSRLLTPRCIRFHSLVIHPFGMTTELGKIARTEHHCRPQVRADRPMWRTSGRERILGGPFPYRPAAFPETRKFAATFASSEMPLSEKRGCHRLTAPGDLARLQCTKNRNGRQQTGRDIDNGDAVLGRLIVDLPGDRHQTGFGLKNEVVAGVCGTMAHRDHNR